MILKISNKASESDLRNISESLNSQGLEVKPVILEGHRYLVTSASVGIDLDAVKHFGVEKSWDLKTEYQLSTRAFKPENTIIELDEGLVFGTNSTIMISGPCSVESETQIMKTAEFLTSKFGIRAFRAGAFKPRTSPYTFQGLEDRGLRLLEKVKQEFGVKIVTEVKDESHLSQVADVADIIQIGTKAMYNFTLLERCGKLNNVILLKRGFMATIKEFLQCADFIMSNGNHRVILCERGIRTFEPQTRFCLDVCAAALIKDLSHLPIVLDPSHAMGHSQQVPTVARAAAAIGCDGLLVETHPDPAEAKSDKEQALSFEQFTSMYEQIKNICSAINYTLI